MSGVHHPVEPSRRHAPFERAERIGEFWSYPQSRSFAELLNDAEEDRVVRAVLVGMLREEIAGRDRRPGSTVELADT